MELTYGCKVCRLVSFPEEMVGNRGRGKSNGNKGSTFGRADYRHEIILNGINNPNNTLYNSQWGGPGLFHQNSFQQQNRFYAPHNSAMQVPAWRWQMERKRKKAEEKRKEKKERERKEKEKEQRKKLREQERIKMAQEEAQQILREDKK